MLAKESRALARMSLIFFSMSMGEFAALRGAASRRLSSCLPCTARNGLALYLASSPLRYPMLLSVLCGVDFLSCTSLATPSGSIDVRMIKSDCWECECLCARTRVGHSPGQAPRLVFSGHCGKS